MNFDLANLITVGYFDELGDFQKDPDGVENPSSEREATGFKKAFFRLVKGLVPNYGMYVGGNWGTSDWGNNPDLIMNRADEIALQHDIGGNEWNWLVNTWSTKPSNHQWVGPIGAVYSVLGSLIFAPASVVKGQAPFMSKDQEQDRHSQETQK